MYTRWSVSFFFNYPINGNKFNDVWAVCTGDWQIQIFSEPFLFGSKSSWLYNILDPHLINVAIPLSNLSPSHILMVTFLPAYTIHMDTSPSSMPPVQFKWRFYQEHFILFSLGTRCISCYFCSVKIRLLLLHQRISKGFSSQYPTIGSDCFPWLLL